MAKKRNSPKVETSQDTSKAPGSDVLVDEKFFVREVIDELVDDVAKQLEEAEGAVIPDEMSVEFIHGPALATRSLSSDDLNRWQEEVGKAVAEGLTLREMKPRLESAGLVIPPLRSVLVVRTRHSHRSYRRTGRVFDRHPVELDLAELSEAEVERLVTDPWLITKYEER